MKIEWSSDESHVLINPRLLGGKDYREKLEEIDLKGHIWIGTSGSTHPK